MSMTKKGLKMNISKVLRNQKIDQSKEVTTEIRGKHALTNGFRIEEVDNETMFIYWHDDNLDFEIRLKIIKNIYSILQMYGFSDHIELNENVAQITLNNFKENYGE